MTLFFYNKNSHALTKIDNSSLDLVMSVQITWRIQKNRQNSQKIKLSADTKNFAICPVRGALRMVMRARHLAQPDNMPVACYRTKKAPLLLITGSRIATLLHKAVKKVRPSRNIPPIPSVSGLVSYLTRQACPFPSSKKVSVG
jgi:hypothetical protein